MRVAIYVRVSTEEQAQEGFSIDGQISALHDFCKHHGYEVVKCYKDEGVSAKSISKRYQLQQMLEDSKSQQFDLVLVWKLNRLARNQLDLLKIIQILEENNVKFNSISEGFDLTNPMGKFGMQLMGAVAELERNQIVENVKMGMTQRANEGLWNGGSMLGYTSINKELVIVESEAELVRYIFALYIEGYGFKAIANRLNHEGYKTKKGVAFSINSIRQIITNPSYAGFIRFNKQTDWETKRRKGTNSNPLLVKGKHQPIIDSETWNKALAIFQSKSHKPPKTFTGHFPLTTLLRCPQCGQGMIGHRSKRSKNQKEYIRYYQCGNFRQKGSAVCSSNLVKADEAEEYVYKKIEEIASNKALLAILVQRVNNKVSTLKEPLERQLQHVRGRIKEVNNTAQGLLFNLEKDNFNNVFIMGRLNQLQDELKKLQAHEAEVESELQRPTVREIPFPQIHRILSNFSRLLKKAEPEKQKELLHSIINKITVHPGNNPTERSIKEIELFFDASLKNDDFVLTYGMVQLNGAIDEKCKWELTRPAPFWLCRLINSIVYK
ncbi:recombinase family protein [Paenibacillus flagellatus]|nr:recombinase family protein [Paenibacillus flagellatus]